MSQLFTADLNFFISFFFQKVAWSGTRWSVWSFSCKLCRTFERLDPYKSYKCYINNYYTRSIDATFFYIEFYTYVRRMRKTTAQFLWVLLLENIFQICILCDFQTTKPLPSSIILILYWMFLVRIFCEIPIYSIDKQMRPLTSIPVQ